MYNVLIGRSIMDEPNDQNSPRNEPEDDPDSLEVTVPAAVRALRASLGESQQAFATRIGISIRALANYEKNRLPSGKALFKMMDLVAESGREDWRALFRQAAYSQFQSDTFSALSKTRGGARDLLLKLHKSVMDL